MARWGPLVVLAAAQLLLVLDTAVMNVSIGTRSWRTSTRTSSPSSG